MTSLCRDCGRMDRPGSAAAGCPHCGSPRLVTHRELGGLAIAHVDCDAFYALVEKRDRPELRDHPLIVGGGIRGVVLTCCYLARRSGVRSAMPMAQAMRLCPEAEVVRPDMEKYRRESRRIRELMVRTAPVVEQISIDEAYLDFTASAATELPARALARLAWLVEKRVGVTISIGLASNKMLAKIASDLGKPRGFCVIGTGDAGAVLASLKVSVLPGVGPVTAKKLAELGYSTIAELRAAKPDELLHRFGLWGRQLGRYAEGEDTRRVGQGRRHAVTVAAERTFERDLSKYPEIAAEVAALCTRLADRLLRAELAAASLTLKLRRSDRRTTTHACRPHDPTMRAETILDAIQPVLARALDGSSFRLVGVCARDLVPARLADPPDLFAGSSMPHSLSL